MLTASPNRLVHVSRSSGLIGIAAALAGAGLAVSSPLGAQTWSPGAVEDPSAAICMSRDIPAGFEGLAEVTPVVVPARDVGGMVAKGFKVSGCSKLFASSEEQLRWRDNVCGIAAMDWPGMAETFARRVGERPAVLCGMAQLALGRRSQERN